MKFLNHLIIISLNFSHLRRIIINLTSVIKNQTLNVSSLRYASRKAVYDLQ